jgi:hypothetical protein
VLGNYIGLNAAGIASIPNGFGVIIEDAGGGTASGNVIGGWPPVRNVISGNTVAGVEIHGNGASGNTVEANFIGTTSTGTAALGNTVGVSITDAPANNVGVAGIGNFISGNTLFGIEITGASASGNLIQGNYIGTAPVGLSPLGNGSFGIIAAGSGPNLIGGTASGYANRIAYNGDAGLLYSLHRPSPSAKQSCNSIYSNGGLAST